MADKPVQNLPDGQANAQTRLLAVQGDDSLELVSLGDPTALVTEAEVEADIEAHNTDPNAHQDIRDLIAPVGATLTGRWQMNSNAGAVPGGQQITTDTGDFQSGVAWIRFADVDQTGLDLSAVLLVLEVGSVIVGQQTANADNRAVVRVAGAPTDGGSYVEVPAETVSAVGAGAAWQNVAVGLPMAINVPSAAP